MDTMHDPIQTPHFDARNAPEAPPRGDDVATLGIPGESLVLVRAEAPSTFSFSLHSRLNTRLLAGGPIPYAGELAEAIDALVERCASESAYRVEVTAAGHVLALVDADDRVIGRSGLIGNEALCRAMLRLTPGQARRAKVVRLPRPD